MTSRASATHRYLALHLPFLASERVRRSTTAPPPDAPFALVEKIKGAMRIAALDRCALALGLECGLTLADARARVPELLAVDHDPPADAALLGWLADACDRYTPAVALDPPDGLILDIAGCTHLFSTKAGRRIVSEAEQGLASDVVSRFAREGLTVRHALSASADAAGALARYGGQDVRALPVTALRCGADTHHGLKRAGLRTIGDVAKRPRAPLAARFGSSFPPLLARMLGEAATPLVWHHSQPMLIAEQRFAEPVARTEDVLATLAALAERLVTDLRERGEGGRRFAAALFRSDNHVARLAVETGAPTRDPALVMRLMRERIDALADPLDPGFGYDSIRLAVTHTEPLASAQLALVGGSVAESEVAALLDRLAVRLGKGRVRRFLPADTHIPEQAVLELPVADSAARPWPAPEPGEPPLRPLHLFDPPHRIQVIADVPDGPPRRFQWRKGQHVVVAHEGPERIAAEWWRRSDGKGLTRDYYRVEDARGRRFWVFRHGLYGAEKAHPDWYLHGLFA
ncbi:MAG: Y-family DNA polymerase [Sphingomonadaceae bacterium]